MPTTFRPYQPDQLLMLPGSLQDWLPEGHLSQHVSDLVDGLDLRVFYDRYEGDGRRKSPYECQSALNIDPLSASKIDPPEQASWGAALES